MHEFERLRERAVPALHRRAFLILSRTFSVKGGEKKSQKRGRAVLPTPWLYSVPVVLCVSTNTNVHVGNKERRLLSWDDLYELPLRGTPVRPCGLCSSLEKRALSLVSGCLLQSSALLHLPVAVRRRWRLIAICLCSLLPYKALSLSIALSLCRSLFLYCTLSVSFSLSRLHSLNFLCSLHCTLCLAFLLSLSLYCALSLAFSLSYSVTCNCPWQLLCFCIEIGIAPVLALFQVRWPNHGGRRTSRQWKAMNPEPLLSVLGITRMLSNSIPGSA